MGLSIFASRSIPDDPFVSYLGNLTLFDNFLIKIEKINILQATHKAMHNAVKNLSTDFILVDGLPVSGFFCNSENIIKGDLLSLSISAASIIAKVTRDRIMLSLIHI